MLGTPADMQENRERYCLATSKCGFNQLRLVKHRARNSLLICAFLVLATVFIGICAGCSNATAPRGSASHTIHAKADVIAVNKHSYIAVEGRLSGSLNGTISVSLPLKEFYHNVEDPTVTITTPQGSLICTGSISTYSFFSVDYILTVLYGTGAFANALLTNASARIVGLSQQIYAKHTVYIKGTLYD